MRAQDAEEKTAEVVVLHEVGLDPSKDHASWRSAPQGRKGAHGGAEMPVLPEACEAVAGAGMAWREGMQRAFSTSEACRVR